MKFARIIWILESNGFSIYRQGKGSHCIYKGMIRGETKMVVAAAHRLSEDAKPGTLQSIIRQSGLDKKLFR